MALTLELSGILWWNFAYTLVYWQDEAHEIVKWHLGLVEVLPRFKFWKKMWKLTTKPFGIFWNNFADTLMLKRSSPRNCKMTFIIGRRFAECQILKKWKWPYLLNWVEYFDKLLRKHWYWQNLSQEIVNWHFYRSRLCRAPNSEKVKMALFLELWRIVWWDFAYALILTRCSQCDCQMSFGIGRGVAEFQILKNSETGPISWNFLNILIKLCINILLTWARQRDYQMSFIISRGYAEVQILKTSESDPLSF